MNYLSKSCARHEGVYRNMKSRQIVSAVVIPQVFSVIVKANHIEVTVLANHMRDTYTTSPCTHFNGTVRGRLSYIMP